MEHNTVAVLHGLQEARLAVNYLLYDLGAQVPTILMAVYCLFLAVRHLSRAFYIDRVRREREERLNRKVMALMRSFGE